MKPRSSEDTPQEARPGEEPEPCASGQGDPDGLSSPPPAHAAETSPPRSPRTPIPLLTPVPISPPFAAVELASGSAAPRPPGPAAAALVGGPTTAREVSPICPAAPLGDHTPEETRYTGEVLRRAREARGLTIAQICDRTKILRSHMENVEADRYERLPAPVYLRGILMALAKELRLDGQRVARSYLETAAGVASPGPKV